MRPMVLIFALLLVSLRPSAAHAQGLAAPSLDIDPSIRSAGMGGATGAVFWGGDGNYWANPALLGDARGFRYEYGTTQLVPDLASGVFFKTSRFSAGAGGIGVATAGKPDGSGYIRLDYGVFSVIDPAGPPILGLAYEQVSMFAVGASLSGLVSSGFRAAGEETPPLFQMLDVAAGYAENDVRVVLGGLPGEGSATGKNWGTLGRMTVPFPLDASPRTAPVRFEGSYGHSVSNYNDDAAVSFEGLDAPPLDRTFRDGGVARVAIGLPRSYRRVLKKNDLGWLARGLDPYLSLGVAFQRDAVQIGGNESSRYLVDRWGVEASLANIVTMRYGHVLDADHDIDGNSWGIGVGFDLGFGGFRYDHAEVPQAEGLRRVEREGWTVYLDPIALIGYMR